MTVTAEIVLCMNPMNRSMNRRVHSQSTESLTLFPSMNPMNPSSAKRVLQRDRRVDGPIGDNSTTALGVTMAFYGSYGSYGSFPQSFCNFYSRLAMNPTTLPTVHGLDGHVTATSGSLWAGCGGGYAEPRRIPLWRKIQIRNPFCRHGKATTTGAVPTP